MKRYLMWSGGADSTASLLICAEKGIPLDGVVMSDMYFDVKNNISAEHPEHINFVNRVAVPYIENVLGYPVIMVRSDFDYLSLFYRKIIRSNHIERVGKLSGFLLGGGRCAFKRDVKIKPLNAWCKAQGDFEKVVGICADEDLRLNSLFKQPFQRSVLSEFGIVKSSTLDIVRSVGLDSPFYSSGRKHQGCWFCPNCSISEFTDLYIDYPFLWNKLETLSLVPDLVSSFFRYDKTFSEIDKLVKERAFWRCNQMSIFDLCRYHE